MKDQATLNDPRKLYPAPPFSNQPQGAPGLARTMEPVPDHGEESYRGSGKTALQPGGGQPGAKVENFGKDSDFARLAQPVELAPVFVLFASQEASFINGEVYASPAEGALPDHDA